MTQNSKITIEEIAQKANVSIATVSRILNNKDTVKPATREKVISIMEELQFKPKAPSSLNNSKSRVILMCVPDFNNPFNSLVIDGVQKAAHDNGYDVLLLQSKDYYTESDDYLNILKNNSLAGMLILSSAPNNKLLEELSFRCPVVMCSEYSETYGVSYVSIDDVAAAQKAVNYLISIGCKKIGFLNCNMKFKYARHREKGYRLALENAGLEMNPEWTAHISSINFNSALSHARHILSLQNRPDALFCTSDYFAVSAIRAANELGIKVPEELSIIGFDNIDLSLMCNPPLTTIEQPCFDIGFQACELLIEKILNPNAPDKQVILHTELVVRSSTKL